MVRALAGPASNSLRIDPLPATSIAVYAREDCLDERGSKNHFDKDEFCVEMEVLVAMESPADVASL